jgi:ABC-2 type transport system ATP-binding protein
MTMPAIIEMTDVRKSYRRPYNVALDNLSLVVDTDSIYAFVGPNGAGKTTAIRIMAGLLAYDQGSVRIGGFEVKEHKRDVRQLIGYIPDMFGFYDDMLVEEYLVFFAKCYGVDTHKHQELTNDLLELVGLPQRRRDPVRSLSRGMLQRLALARALINDPVLIVADEPAANLDPRARFELREMFVLLREMGKTIFLSSHILRELDDIATHMGIIEDGKIVVSGPITDVRANVLVHIKVRVSFLADVENAQAWLAQQPAVQQVYPAVQDVTSRSTLSSQYPELLIYVNGDEKAASELLHDMIGMHFPVLSFTIEQESLESLFLRLTGEPAGG